MFVILIPYYDKKSNIFKKLDLTIASSRVVLFNKLGNPTLSFHSRIYYLYKNKVPKHLSMSRNFIFIIEFH